MADPGAVAHAPGLSIAESPVAVSLLRVRSPDAGLTTALGDAFGLEWPTRPNTVGEGRVRVAWLAPGEWALFDAAEVLAAPVAAALGERLHHLSDVSAGRRLWRVEGERARELLAKGCGLDIHPRSFPPGSCAQTVLAQVAILLIAPGGDGAFSIIADATLAAHLRLWFAEAVQEFIA